MSAFFWREPSNEFNSVIVSPEPADDSLYFVCHKGRVLMNSDKNGKWRSVTAEPLRLFSTDEKHFMGYLGDTGCYVIEVTDPGAFEFADLRSHLDEFESLMFNLAGLGLQISDWFRTRQYCGNCGERTSLHEVDRAMVYDPCRLHFYPRLSPSTGVMKCC